MPRSSGSGGRRRVPLESIGVIGTGVAAGNGIAALGKGLVDFVSGLSEADAKAQIASAQNEQPDIVTRDVTGKIVIKENPFRNETARAIFERQQRSKYLDEIGNDAKRWATDLHVANPTDPAAFDAAWKGKVEGTLTEVPEAFREDVRRKFAELGTTHRNGIVEKQAAVAKASAASAFQTELNSVENDALSLAQAGRHSDPEYMVRFARHAETLARGVENGFLTQEAASLFSRQLADKAEGLGVAAVAEKVYTKAGRGAAGIAAAEKFVKDNITGNAESSLEPSQKTTLQSIAMGRIRDLEAQRRVDVQDVQERASQDIELVRRGANVDLTSMESHRKAFLAAGEPDKAAEISRMMMVQREVQSIAKMPIAEIGKEIDRLREKRETATATRVDVSIEDRLRGVLREKQSEINARESSREADVRLALDAAMADVRRITRDNTIVNRDVMEAHATRLDDLGEHGRAAEIRSAVEYQDRLRANSQSPLPVIRETLHALAEARNDGTASAYDAELERQLVAVVEAKTKALKDDALTYGTQTHVGMVGELAPIDFSSPEKMAEGAATRHRQAMVISEIEGVPVAPFTKPELAQIAVLAKSQASPAEQLDFLARATVDLKDPHAAEVVIGSLEKNGFKDQTGSLRTALDIYQTGDRVRARRLWGELSVPDKDIPIASDVDKAVKQSVDSEFRAGLGAVLAMQHQVTGDARYSDRFNSNLEAATKIARVRAGTTGDTRTGGGAIADLFGDQRGIAERGFAAVTFPTATNMREMEEGMRSIRAQLATDMAARITDPLVRRQFERVSRDAVWINAGDGYTLTLPGSGAPVPGPDGRPIRYTLDQIVGAGRETIRNAPVVPPASATGQIPVVNPSVVEALKKLDFTGGKPFADRLREQLSSDPRDISDAARDVIDWGKGIKKATPKQMADLKAIYKKHGIPTDDLE